MLMNMVLGLVPLAMFWRLILSPCWHGKLTSQPSAFGIVYPTIFRVGEKYLDWVDDPLPSTTILEFASLYWLTETFPRAIYPYREVRTSLVLVRGKDIVADNYL